MEYTCCCCPGSKTLTEMVSNKYQKPYICKACRRVKSKESYQRNKTSYQARAPRRRFESRNFLIKLKSGPCKDCGQKFHFCQMDFDHRNPAQKRLPISKMGLMGLDSIRKEVEKCDLVCVNCHRDRTQKQIVYTPDSGNETYERQKRKKIENFVNSLKNNQICIDCKLPHPYWRLDFDHREESNKSNTISRLKLSKMSKERILKEMEKCDLVCARCHRLRTWHRQRAKRSGLT
jgi:hypothetical protein